MLLLQDVLAVSLYAEYKGVRKGDLDALALHAARLKPTTVFLLAQIKPLEKRQASEFPLAGNARDFWRLLNAAMASKRFTRTTFTSTLLPWRSHATTIPTQTSSSPSCIHLLLRRPHSQEAKLFHATMFASITLLLAALAMSISNVTGDRTISPPDLAFVAAGPTTTAAQANTTTIPVDATTPVNTTTHNTLADHDYLLCFGDSPRTWGTKRKLMIDAIFGACDKMTNGIGEPVAIYGRGEGLESEYKSFHVYKPYNDYDEGQIVVTIHIKDDPVCNGPLAVSWEYCWDQLHTPLDECDTDAENGKNGGVVLDGDCIYWVLDPSPRVNYPYDEYLERD